MVIMFEKNNELARTVLGAMNTEKFKFWSLLHFFLIYMNYIMERKTKPSLVVWM